MWNNIVSIVKLICIVAVSAAAAFFLFEGGQLLRQARASVSELEKNVNQTVVGVNKTLVTVQETAEQAKGASVQANLAAQEQRKYWSKTSLETYKTMASLRETIVRVDKNLTDSQTGVLPHLSAALNDTDKLSVQAAQSLKQTTDKLQPSLDNLARASSAAADRMSDPSIKDTLLHVDETSAQVAQTAQHIQESTAMLEEKVRQLTRPAKWWVTVVTSLLDYTAKAAQITVGFIK